MEFSLINLLLVLLVAWVAGAAASRLGYPSILGELAAGILFGPAVLGLLHPSEGLEVLAEVGVFLMMLYIGMEVDYRDLAKASWAGLLAATGGFCVPLFLGYTVTLQFGFSNQAALFLGLAMGVTSLATKSRILVDLNLLGTRIANVLFAAALICDTTALIVFALIMGLVGDAGVEMGTFALVVFKALLFFGVTITIGLRVFPMIGELLRRLGFTERTTNFTLVVMIGLVFAELAELAGLHSILGAFLAGMFLRGEVLKRKVSHEVTTLVHDLSLGFLAPIFFVSAGFHVSFSVFLTDLPLLLLIVFLAFTGKIFGAALFYLPSRNGWREGLTIGCGMNGHGAVEIIIAGIALEKGIIEENLFSILIFMAFISTSTVPIFMKWGVDWLRRRGELVRADDKRSGVIILGASPLARVVAREIQPYETVALMDSNANRCRAAEGEGLVVITGNALSEATLDVAGGPTARALFALTSNPDVNAVATQRASELFGIPEIYAIQHSLERHVSENAEGEETPDYIPFMPKVYPYDLWNRWVSQKEVQIERFSVKESTPTGSFLDRLGDPELVLPLLVNRAGRRTPVGGISQLEPGDEVTLLRHEGQRDPLEHRFEQLVLDAPFIDHSDRVSMEQIFEEISHTLGARLAMEPDEINRLLTARETDSSTVIFPGVAIPHIMIDGEGRSDLMLIRCQEGATFFGADSDARIVFAIVGTRDERKFHLRILSSIAQLFQDPTFEERWMNADSEEAIKQTVLSTERRLF